MTKQIHLLMPRLDVPGNIFLLIFFGQISEYGNDFSVILNTKVIFAIAILGIACKNLQNFFDFLRHCGPNGYFFGLFTKNLGQCLVNEQKKN